ncbi:QsdR family transcriptional regulator [Mycolicibacterium mucogenicum]|uniref:QsdR family transcriptional regulator n=1 Tax=Mycolicibacterium mucogenicum TaxID=56689 RepID=UPI001EEE80E9|nr:QsdR family transcriptional regulator [Mycolicibacterium mucogenicum]MCX8554026.1 QsdR family transcriptional regulator [Mycolicibacterium mucogenicum]
MSGADSTTPAPSARLGTALSRQAAVDAATRLYLAGEPVDMSALAAELGIGRSTLYRLVGNREDLLAIVLAEATERTFRRTVADMAAEAGSDTEPPGGTEYILAVMDRFLNAVVDAKPLQAVSQREPLLIVRLMLLPGLVEQTAGRLVGELLDAEVAAGRMELPLPTATFGLALIRMCDAHLYAPLLGGGAPEIGTALDLVAALLGHSQSGEG